MWSILSLSLLVVMLVLSCRFYLQHCWPSSSKHGRILVSALQKETKPSPDLAGIAKTTTCESDSSKITLELRQSSTTQTPTMSSHT
jgi:hypothetical protein